MKLTRLGAMAATVAMVAVLVALVAAIGTPQPVKAEWTNPQLIVYADGVTTQTATYTTTARWIGNNTRMTTFATISAAALQTVTLTLQCSPNGVFYQTCATLIASAANGTVSVPITETAAPGNYMRLLMTASGSTTYTPTVMVVLK